MNDILTALAFGAAVGGAFNLAGLNVPAPGTAAGVAGVVGLWAGFTLAAFLRTK